MCDKRYCNCKKKSEAQRIDPEVLKKLERGYDTFSQAKSSSLLKKYLTREMFDELKNRKTSYGSSLLDVIQSGFANPDSGIGVYAPDRDAYKVFAKLFDAVIEDYHFGFGPRDTHPMTNWGNPSSLGNVDPEGKYVISTRVRCGRSLEGFPFVPRMTEEQYKEIARKVADALGTLEGELKGKFYSLETMDKKTQQQLIDDHFLFKEGDRFLQAANACRFWPVGRGIYHNDAKTFLVWCNEEDHMRLISMQKGGDLAAVYKRLVDAVNKCEKKFEFARDNRLGFLTFCPTNLGTTIRASVHIKLPRLSKNMAKFEEIAASHNLQVRGTAGEHSESADGVYDVSNKRRMGLTEFEALQEMKHGILAMIEKEEKC